MPGGTSYALFLILKPGVQLDGALIGTISAKLRQNCGPRHVPDRMYQVELVPHTLTHKKMEVLVRRIPMGWTLDAMMNPEAIDFFVRFRKRL